MSKTVFVTLTDEKYYPKAVSTINSLRGPGGWAGDIVLLCVDFLPDHPPSQVILHGLSHIDHTPLFECWKEYPIRPMADRRHQEKVYQWDKLQVFSEYFKQWDRVVFLDAGLRVCNSVTPLLALDWQGKLLAQDDDPFNKGKRLACQFDWEANHEVVKKLLKKFPCQPEQTRYFLNTMFLFDTQLIKENTLYKLIRLMYEYPISLCNEMGIMNLYFHVKKGVWQPFPLTVNDKYLFGWSELDYPGKRWSDFHFIKYSVT